MIRRTKLARFDRVAEAHSTLPLRRALVLAGYEHLRETGELPDDQRLADAVARTALNGGKLPKEVGPMSDLERALTSLGPVRLTVVSSVDQLAAAAPSVREALLHDAVFETGVPKRSARSAIMWLVDGGEDVTDPQFAASRGLPKFGCVGMHVLGWPRHLAQPPYIDQAHRLFARMESLTDRIDHNDPDWFEPIANAALRFAEVGELPAAGLVRNLVLALEELDLLAAHRRGVNVAKKMAALDRVATTHGDAQETAVRALTRHRWCPSTGERTRTTPRRTHGRTK